MEGVRWHRHENARAQVAVRRLAKEVDLQEADVQVQACKHTNRIAYLRYHYLERWASA